jgi:glycosyltransferase involved in cell wall biosynthesis
LRETFLQPDRQQVKKILIIPERYGSQISGCGWIRLIHPYKQFSQMKDFEVRVGDWKICRSWRPDVVVTQRIVASPENLKNLKLCIEQGSKLVFDLDDDLLNIPREHPDFVHYQKFIDPIKQFIESASKVTLSTSHLMSMLGLTGDPKVEIVENEISYEHWFGESNFHAKVKSQGIDLLYFGTSSHQKDWEMIKEPTLDWLSDNRHAKLTLIGVTNETHYFNRQISNVLAPIEARSSYPAFVNWIRQINTFDIGLAPLIDSNFNRAKSGLKVLEYSALGLVSVASSIDPYAKLEGRLKSMVLAENSNSSWYKSLDTARELRVKTSFESVRTEVNDFGTIASNSDSQNKLRALIAEITQAN